MRNLEILLRDSVDSLGECGDVVKVAAGFARNYLFPKGLAVEATPENRRLMERRRVRLQAESAAKHAEMDSWVDALSQVTLKTASRADENGHLYGSVSEKTIVELLAGAGHTVEEKNVRLDEPIKTVGSHTARIHVYGERYAEVAVEVAAE